MPLYNLWNDRLLPQGSVIPSEAAHRLLPLLAPFIGTRSAGVLLTALGVEGFSRASVDDIRNFGETTDAAAELLVLVRELGLFLSRLSPRSVRSLQDVLTLLPAGFEREESEILLAIALTTSFAVKGVLFLAKGGSFALTISARDVLAPLVRLRAAAFILVHNHPCGDPKPSEEDVVFTNRVAVAAHILGLALADHVVVGTGGSVSFADIELLPTPSELEAMSLGTTSFTH